MASVTSNIKMNQKTDFQYTKFTIIQQKKWRKQQSLEILGGGDHYLVQKPRWKPQSEVGCSCHSQAFESDYLTVENEAFKQRLK